MPELASLLQMLKRKNNLDQLPLLSLKLDLCDKYLKAKICVSIKHYYSNWKFINLDTYKYLELIDEINFINSHSVGKLRQIRTRSSFAYLRWKLFYQHSENVCLFKLTRRSILGSDGTRTRVRHSLIAI